MDLTPWPAEFAERYRAAGYWRGESFSAAIRSWADAHGDRVAVVDGDVRRTYRELDARASRFAAGFAARGIAPGDRVVVQLPNTADFFDVVFGLFRLGAVPVFALPAHRESELSYFCRHAEAVALVIPGVHEGFDHGGLVPAVRAAAPSVRHVFTAGDDLGAEPVDLADPGASGLAFLQLSGGSTGLPKLIPRTADDYLYSVRASAGICGLSPASVYLCALPVAHNFPLSSPGVLGVLHAGGTVVMCPRPSPDVAFPLIERERVTITALVPPLALVWLTAAEHTGADLSSLEVLQVGGAKLTADAARRVRPVLGCAVQQVFGMAEGLVNYTRLDDPAEVLEETQGRPISPDDELLVVDDAGAPVPPGGTGHLLTRGPYTIRGYYRAEEHNATAFTPDGFYRTGDLVRITPAGYVVVTGRAKDQINRGGEKIAAEEVENHLLAHPAVHDAAVVAVPDAYLGERTCAFVTLSGDGPVSPAQLRAFVRSRGLAAFKVPDKVQIVDAFPVTGVGKVSRTDLRAALRAHLARES
ncbi:(2,3-dihydroxybenzoyl)adenylate synthase [Spirilliplanes yamanashiensis]|uniref:2,3-dihydroxybenzoate-AMP ligase n=1 Tax=Spirilliplanes yamanashiensis TaxID=42233 RepID=A0A8J3YEM0_9ACTN|nr:(2,3-dihydroxybenzoyl)adenylate synthase [Spirilliplanes yamanashiensis]MDP9815202.1 2,3-dihydroxybenzoate-AMP ligase [Spirilliplanes yamanashiensis]GIJ06530.1 2,3-dihydroxybenzoate-AMP ligase [Spirilliplanes yamanashiensis]